MIHKLILTTTNGGDYIQLINGKQQILSVWQCDDQIMREYLLRHT